ncbi:MAG: ion channel [Desulfovibrionales bacterium]
MIRIALGVTGALIIGMVLWDIIGTTLLLSGGGPLTTRVTNRIWKVFLAVHRHGPFRNFLSYCGVGLILGTITFWIMAYWAGWTLIFSVSESAVLEAQTEVPATFLQRAYYTGFTFITLGTGDFKPGNAFWQILTVFLAVSGFFMVTLVITYLLPVVSAVVEKRQLAIHIRSMSLQRNGLLPSSSRMGLQGLITNLQPLSERVSRLGQQHLAYPILHYMHAADPNASLPLALAELDETLTLIFKGAAELPPEAETLLPLRHSLTFYLSTVHALYSPRGNTPPPALPLDMLHHLGLTPLASKEFTKRIHDLEERRRMLQGLVQHSGWTWQDIQRFHHA